MPTRVGELQHSTVNVNTFVGETTHGRLKRVHLEREGRDNGKPPCAVGHALGSSYTSAGRRPPICSFILN